MAQSYVQFHGKGFHLNDSDLVVFAGLLVRASKADSTIPIGVVNLLRWWEESLDSSGPGCICLQLDDFITDADSLSHLCILINAALDNLREMGPVISVNQLNDIVKEGAWFVGDRNTKDFEAIAGRFQHLIGCPQPRRQNLPLVLIFLFALVSIGCQHKTAGTQLSAAPQASDLAPDSQCLFGSYIVSDIVKYRGGVTTAADARRHLGSKLTINGSRFSLFDVKINDPVYRINYYPQLSEGEVPTDDYRVLSNFWGIGTKRFVVVTLTVKDCNAASGTEVLLEVIDTDTLWFGFDGWLYQFTREGVSAQPIPQ